MKAIEDAQAFGDGSDEPAVRHAQADIFGDVHAEQERTLLRATGADAPLLAGEGDEELVAAIGADDASEAVLEITTLELCRMDPIKTERTDMISNENRKTFQEQGYFVLRGCLTYRAMFFLSRLQTAN